MFLFLQMKGRNFEKVEKVCRIIRIVKFLSNCGYTQYKFKSIYNIKIHKGNIYHFTGNST